MRLLGCDVDDVIVSPPWKEWILDNPNADKLDFWRSDTLYDNLEPIKGSVQALEQLSKYFGIVFISKLKGQHHSSKVKFVKKYFPFFTEFVGTHGKWVLNNSVEVMIDDKYEMLKGFDAHKRVLYSTPYKQETVCSVDSVIQSWDTFNIKSFCDRYL